MKSVCVLISTYNGEKYIEEQLRSIDRNLYGDIDICVYIRDDGSTDGTVELIGKISNQLKITVKVHPEKNIGVQKSFLALLHNAPEADFYFFCDQDDKWTDNKVHEFLNAIDTINEPSLAVSGYYLTDADFNVIRERNLESIKISLPQILFANSTPGCVMGFNKSLLDLLKKTLPVDVPMHDLYTLAVAYICGRVIVIRKPLVYYRQHGENTEGVQSEKVDFHRLIKKQRKMFSTKTTSATSLIAAHLLNTYLNCLTPEDQAFLSIVENYTKHVGSKIKLLMEPNIYRKNLRSDLLKIESIIFNKI